MKLTLLFLTLFSIPTVWASASCSQVLENYEKRHPRLEWDYDWTTAVFLYGALTYTQHSPQSYWGEEEVDALFESFAKKAPRITMPDLASMSLPATLAKGAGAEEVRKLSEEFFKTEPLNKIGAIDHVGVRHKFAWFLPPTHWFSPSALWADSIIMYVLNGYALARLRNDQEKMNFFLNQVELFATYLRDEKNGLYKHAYYVESKKRYPYDGHWARGNLWMDLGLIELIGMMPANHPSYEKFKTLLADHLSALKKVAGSRGLHTVLEDKDSYEETSATALLAYVLKKGIRMNVIEKTYGPWAEEMVRATLQMVQNGSLTGISGPTTAFPYTFYYKYLVRPGSDISYGVGAFLLMCSEI